MWLLLIEAGVALLLLVLIVWWTMYAGPKPPARPLREAPRTDTAAQSPPGSDTAAQLASNNDTTSDNPSDRSSGI